MKYNVFNVGCKSVFIILIGLMLSYCGGDKDSIHVPANTDPSGALKKQDVAFVENDIIAPVGDGLRPASLILKWKLTALENTVRLPLVENYFDHTLGEVTKVYDYNFTVNWGDASPEELIVGYRDDVSRTYNVVPGEERTVTIRITGSVGAWSFGGRYPSVSCDGLIAVESLGDVGFENLASAFAGCKDLESVNGGDTSNVKYMNQMFHGATSLTHVETVAFDFSNVETTYLMFSHTPALKCVDFTDAQFGQLKNMYGMFNNAGVENVSFEDLDLSNVTNVYALFMGAVSLEEVSFRNTDLGNIELFSNMFLNNPNLYAVDLRNTKLWSDGPIVDDIYSFESAVNSGTQFYCSADITSVQGKSCADTILDDYVFFALPKCLEGVAVDLVLTPVESSPLALVSIGGSCFSNGINAITISPLRNFAILPSGPIQCHCSNGLIAGCRNEDGTIENIQALATENLTATITGSSGLTASDQEKILVSESLVDLTFGNHSTYWEDGLSSICIKMSPTKVFCYGAGTDNKGSGDWAGRLGSGVTIETIRCLEASCYIVDSLRRVWSWGFRESANGTLPPVGRVGDFKTPNTVDFRPSGRLLDAQGHHASACLLFDQGSVWCFTGSMQPQQKLLDVKFIHGGLEQYCYVTHQNQLFCQRVSLGEVPFDTSGIHPIEFVADNIGLFVSNSWTPTFGTGSVAVDTQGKVFLSTNQDALLIDSGQNIQMNDFVSPHNQQFVDLIGNTCFLNDRGEAFYNGTIQPGRGSGNIGIHCDENKIHVLGGDGRLYTGFESTSPYVGGFSDVINFVGFAMDICLIKSDLKTYCYGSRSGGTAQAPTLAGTYQP